MNSNENPERSVRLQLAAAAIRGVLSGAVRAVVSWFIQEHIHLL